MSCPKCGGELASKATFCDCGWRKHDRKALARPEIPPCSCAHAECPRPARVRMRRPQGWADVCDFHYLEHVTDDARDWLADNNLLRRPTETMRQWMDRTSAFFVDRKPEPIVARAGRACQARSGCPVNTRAAHGSDLCAAHLEQERAGQAVVRIGVVRAAGFRKIGDQERAA